MTRKEEILRKFQQMDDSQIDNIIDDGKEITNHEWRKKQANYAKNDYLRFKPELIQELAKPFTSAQSMIDYKGENEDQIRSAGRYIEHGVCNRPEWFDPIIKGNQESLEECVKIALQYKHINEVPQRIKNRMWYLSDKKTVRELLKDLEWNRRPRTDEEVLDIMADFKSAGDMRKHSNEFRNLLSRVSSKSDEYPKSYIRYKEMCNGHTTRNKRGKYKQRTPAIVPCDLNKNVIQVFQTWDEALEAGFKRNSIAGAIRGTDGHNKHKGFLWRHEDQDFTK